MADARRYSRARSLSSMPQGRISAGAGSHTVLRRALVRFCGTTPPRAAQRCWRCSTDAEAPADMPDSATSVRETASATSGRERPVIRARRASSMRIAATDRHSVAVRPPRMMLVRHVFDCDRVCNCHAFGNRIAIRVNKRFESDARLVARCSWQSFRHGRSPHRPYRAIRRSAIRADSEVQFEPHRLRSGYVDVLRDYPAHRVCICPAYGPTLFVRSWLKPGAGDDQLASCVVEDCAATAHANFATGWNSVHVHVDQEADRAFLIIAQGDRRIVAGSYPFSRIAQRAGRTGLCCMGGNSKGRNGDCRNEALHFATLSRCHSRATGNQMLPSRKLPSRNLNSRHPRARRSCHVRRHFPARHALPRLARH